MTTKRDVVEKLYIGQGIAERETDTLAQYFFQTIQWDRIYAGEIDIILGPKGSGKSAIYFLLKKREGELEQRGIYLVTAENPQGEPVFRQIVTASPKDERSFSFLWKLYFLVIATKKLDEFPAISPHISPIVEILKNEGLLPTGFSLARALRSVLDYVKSHLSFSAVEGHVELDPVTGLPKVFGKITFDTPSEKQRKVGISSVEELLSELNSALEKSKHRVWVVLDRLDVVFEEDKAIERLALRSLFRVYNDFFGLKNISLKIFLRDDIWKTITEGGFREASHFVRRVELTWNRNSLANLLMRRIVSSQLVLTCFGIDPSKMLNNFEKQILFFNSLFPSAIPIFGDVLKQALDWIVFSTKDGKGINTPREVIELLNFAREFEVSRLERGEQVARDNILFGQEALFAAVKRLSKYKIEQTILSEYPEVKKYINALYNRKQFSFTDSDLMKIWEIDNTEAQLAAVKLGEIGFFRVNPNKSYTIPHFYGYGLGIGARDPRLVIAGTRHDAESLGPDEVASANRKGKQRRGKRAGKRNKLRNMSAESKPDE
jgi:hypothetical protein